MSDPKLPSGPDLASAGRTPVIGDAARVAEVFARHRDEPLSRFSALLALARAEPRQLEATAMSLATVGEGGRPSSRIVLLKEAGPDGLVFYTNLDSHKGRSIAARPDVALLFHWQALELQVRFEGRAAQVSDAEADAYFATRPRQSQLGAWASEQSGTLASREVLLARLAEISARHAGQSVPRPPRWGGFRVAPLLVEFWKGDRDRLHEREVYERSAPGAPWAMRLLFP